MFILRKEHEDAFGVAGLQRFAKKAVRMLRQDHGELASSFESYSLLELVWNGITVARHHGLMTERQMYKLCEAKLILSNAGKHFDLSRDPTVLKLLRNIASDADSRAALVLQYAISGADRGRH